MKKVKVKLSLFP